MADGGSALSTGLALMGLQLLSRLLTFGLNQALVRLTTPAALGLATIQFEVLLNTILFLSREGIRGALVRRVSVSNSADPTNDRQRLFVNASFLPLLCGPLVSLVVSGIYIATLDQTTLRQPYFRTSLSLYLLATLLELVAEPLFIRSLVENDTRTRVRIEGSAVIVKTLTTLGVVLAKGEEWGLLGFALGQAAYGGAMAAGFWWYYARKQPQQTLVPRSRSASDGSKSTASYLDPQDVSLSWALTRQSLVKHFLSEGDKMIVGRISPVEDQGGYAIALNYGSLIARILFQPVEETARLHFSRTLGAASLPSESNNDKPDDKKRPSQPDPYVPAAEMLSSLVFMHLHLSLIFLAFGPPYISTLLTLLLGRSSRYLSTSAPSVLRAYCYLLPLLGLNGVIEAFVQAVATHSQLASMSRAMALWSIVFVAATWAGTRAIDPSEVGMIVATGVTMACRIVWGAAFTRQYFTEAGPQVARDKRAKLQEATAPQRALPNRYTIVAFAVAAQVVRLSASRTGRHADLGALLRHLVVGVVSGLASLAVIAFTERNRLRTMMGSLKRRS